MGRRLIMFMCFACLPVFAGTASADLVGYWDFDEGSGTTATDQTGIIGDGTFTGNVSWVAGMSGTALQFDGDGDYVTLPNTEDSKLRSSGTYTIAVWVKVEKTDNGVILMVGEGCSTWSSWFLGVGGGEPDAARDEGNLVFAVRAGGGSAYTGVATPLEPDVWVHIAATYDGSLVRLYQDGMEVASVEATLPYDNGDPFYMGADPGCSGRQYFGGAIDELQIYNEALPEAEIRKVMRGSAGLSSTPFPEDGATDVPRDVVLSWLAGDFAVAHDVYLGTSFDDVNDADRSDATGLLVSEGQADTMYTPPAVLEFGQTYYWRVDEVNAAPDNTIFKGDTWSFTIEPLAYPVENIVVTSTGTSQPGSGPERTVDGSGLNANDEHSAASGDMWQASPPADGDFSILYEFGSVVKLHEMLVWNYNVQFELILGFGLKDVTVEYSENGTDWTVLGDVQFAQATALPGYTANTTVAFNGIPVRFVRLTINSGYGGTGQYGLSEVRFLYIPAQAREPEPADGATDVSIGTALDWRAGREAVSHEVHLGTDAEALPLVETTTDTGYTPAPLDMATTYFWRVDEVNEADQISVWTGNLWSFDTEPFIIIDDFEDYNDDDNVIYETWIDGWINDTGSTAGYLTSPFTEQDIVHGGGQSMPLSYDNVGVATAEAELPLGQDWTASGIRSLSLYFYGDPDNSGGQLYVKIGNTRVDYDGSVVNLTRPTWHLWNIDLTASGANLSNVATLIIGIEGAGANGILYIDDIRLYPEVLDYLRLPDVTVPGDGVQGVPNDGDWPAGEEPPNAIDDDVNTKYLHRKGGAQPTGFQVTPAAGPTVVTALTFTTANDAPARDPITYELYGSNGTIDGPYELIATGDIVDFAGATEWPRFTKNETLITFDNDVAYAHYQILFPTLRGDTEALMQIAEVEFIGE